MALCRFLRFLLEQLANDLINHLIGECADFFLRLWLDGMLNQNRFVLRHAESRALRMGSANEFGRRHIRGRDALFFKVDYIVRTARNAGPSIAEGFDDRIALFL